MHILKEVQNPDGPAGIVFVQFGGEVRWPRCAPVCAALAKATVEQQNESINEYNRSVRTAHDMGREIGWFRDMVRDPSQLQRLPPSIQVVPAEDGMVRVTWGPRPAATNEAPLVLMPEWAVGVDTKGVSISHLV